MDLKKLIASFGHAGRGVVEMFIHQHERADSSAGNNRRPGIRHRLATEFA